MHPFSEFVNPHLGKLLEAIKLNKRFVRGEGCYLYDDRGNAYLDCIAAYGALPFGYNPSQIWDVMYELHEQMEPSFIQPSFLDAAGKLAKLLISVSPENLRYVTFTNSGAEATEAAVKMCRSATGRKGILSTIKGFHGKTLGALSATGNSSYQKEFGAPIEGFFHIPFGNSEALESMLSQNPDYFAAFFVEPIQGEGGIVVPPKEYLAEIRQICTKYGVRLVLDEIQTGLGRTGKFYAGAEDATPDVILVAKALGGGIFPIGACISAENTYNESFAMKHSSTFSGNSLACRIGIKTIEMLLSNNSKLIKDVKANGDLLKKSLINLHASYPNIIKSIRGEGFMLGIEFHANRDTFPGSLLGIMGEQELFTPAVSGYLLNVEKLRVAPTLNGNDVIRLEPPLIMSKELCQNAVEKIEKTLFVLKQNSTSRFLSFLLDEKRDIEYRQQNSKKASKKSNVDKNECGRFAFLVHPLNLGNYCDFDESLYDFNPAELEQLTDKFTDLANPFVISGAEITSKTGAKAFGEFIGIPRTADQLASLPKEQAISELKFAISLAKDRGAKIIGLGAYTSVVSGGGLHVKDEGVAITTGNSYTVISAVEAVDLAVQKLDVQISACTAAVIGAAGSIGKGVAALISEKATKLILVGNQTNAKIALDRLLATAAEILRYICSKQVSENGILCESFAYKILSRKDRPNADASIESFINFAKECAKDDTLLLFSTDVDDAVSRSDVIICATSSTTKLLKPENLSKGAIVCDISRPKNIDKDVEHKRPDVLALDGGVIKVPGAPDLGWNFGLDKGLAYACMAETIMLALEEHYEHTSVGASGVTIESVTFLKGLAEKHGFELNELRAFDKQLDSAKIRAIKKEREKLLIN